MARAGPVLAERFGAGRTVGHQGRQAPRRLLRHFRSAFALNRVFIPLDLPPAPLPGAAAQTLILHGPTMGTTWSVKCIPPKTHSAREIETGIRQVLDKVIAQMSTWEAGSDLSRFNRAQADSWHVLPDDFFQVLSCALHVAESSGGAYDPTVGPLVNLWGFGPEDRRDSPPSQDAIDAARRRCGWRKLKLDTQQQRAYQAGDVYVDLSAIAKGFGVDRLARYLRGIGCISYLAEIGGELAGFGLKADGDPWWVEVERPPSGERDERNLLALHGLAIATSGDYRRYFDSAGKRYAHTLDPRSGYPAYTPAAVTVAHRQCMLADAWSTALGVMGEEEGPRFADAHGIAALFVDHSGEEKLSRSMAAMLD